MYFFADLVCFDFDENPWQTKHKKLKQKMEKLSSPRRMEIARGDIDYVSLGRWR